MRGLQRLSSLDLDQWTDRMSSDARFEKYPMGITRDPDPRRLWYIRASSAPTLHSTSFTPSFTPRPTNLNIMGLLTLVEDRPTPSAVYNWRVYVCAMVASFASCMIGYDSAFIGTTLALPSFVHEFGFKHMSPHHLATIKANIVSVYQAGAFFGSLFAYGSVFFLGRRKSLWVFTVIFELGAGIMLISKNGNLAPILAGRVLAGIGVGGASMIVRFYPVPPLCIHSLLVLTSYRFPHTFPKFRPLLSVVVWSASTRWDGSWAD